MPMPWIRTGRLRDTASRFRAVYSRSRRSLSREPERTGTLSKSVQAHVFVPQYEEGPAALDDPYLPIEVTAPLASAWGAQFVDVGRQGQPAGEGLLRGFVART